MKGLIMDTTNGKKILIHWNTKNEESIRLIRKRFNIPAYTTVNGMTPAILTQDNRELFEETARRGFFTYQPIDWNFNGHSYSW